MSVREHGDEETPAHYPEDDPEHGVYWGPPDLKGNPRRWSRVWFDWRSERE